MATRKSPTSSRARTAKPGGAAFRHSTIALIYDFDGTLTPLPMQEYTVFPQLGLDAATFWQEVIAETTRTNADTILTYMRLLVEKSHERNQPLSRRDLARSAKDIEYYPGVRTWFGRMNRYVHARSNGRVTLNHYIISAGLQEILDGISIRKHFEHVYGCAYYFDDNGLAIFPRVVINDTSSWLVSSRTEGSWAPGSSCPERISCAI